MAKVRLMLDSGAYSAWKRGIAISLKDYMAYIQDNLEYVSTYVNLDVIPGQAGLRRGGNQVEEAAAASYKNLQKMKRAGLSPMPVFHQQEDYKWLRQMMKDKEPYIGLSTFKDLSIGENIEWLDHCFTMLTDQEGWPITKTHGFGIGSFELMKRYPWTTCDATSWAMTAAYGAIFVPVFRNGKPDYSEVPIKLTVSEVDRKAGKMPADHYLRFGPLMKKRVEMFLEGEVGVTAREVAVGNKEEEAYEVRAKAIVYFYKRFEEAIGTFPFRHRLRSLL